VRITVIDRIYRVIVAMGTFDSVVCWKKHSS